MLKPLRKDCWRTANNVRRKLRLTCQGLASAAAPASDYTLARHHTWMMASTLDTHTSTHHARMHGCARNAHARTHAPFIIEWHSAIASSLDVLGGNKRFLITSVLAFLNALPLRRSDVFLWEDKVCCDRWIKNCFWKQKELYTWCSVMTCELTNRDFQSPSGLDKRGVSYQRRDSACVRDKKR